MLSLSRPYHGTLLLYEEKELLDQLPLDANPVFRKFILQAKPTKSFCAISLDTDVAKQMVSSVTRLELFYLNHILKWHQSGQSGLVMPSQAGENYEEATVAVRLWVFIV